MLWARIYKLNMNYKFIVLIYIFEHSYILKIIWSFIKFLKLMGCIESIETNFAEMHERFKQIFEADKYFVENMQIVATVHSLRCYKRQTVTNQSLQKLHIQWIKKSWAYKSNHGETMWNIQHVKSSTRREN